MEPRTTAQRLADVKEKLETDEDIWVASASERGYAYLVPLSFSGDGVYLTVATPKQSRTARNLRRAGRARMALGPTRDVVILEGPVTEMALDDDPQLTEEHAARSFDARDEPEEYVFIRLKPEMIQAYRSSPELANRIVMRNGDWLS
jgi:general stress protein 26